MKRISLAILIMLTILLLASCSDPEMSTTLIRATLLDGEHYTVVENTRELEPGSNVFFQIQPEFGYKVVGTDYPGKTKISLDHGAYKVELIGVQYPVRVNPELARFTRDITYDANGGEALTEEGAVVSRSYDVSYHTRPNTSNGTELFARDGYTMTGWNTEPDGSGLRVGLASRVTVDDSLYLYAQWEKWSDEGLFTYTITDDADETSEYDKMATITGYSGDAEKLVIPEFLGGAPVRALAGGSFSGCTAKSVILPKTLRDVGSDAFRGAQLESLSFFDNIVYITDDCFPDCPNFSTLIISAIEDPYGYQFRRESVFSDKMDLLINTMGEDRMLFYGGCSMWYNLIGDNMQKALGDRYRVVNMAINGVSSSLIQMEIIRHFVTERDILFHTPEISSPQQLLTYTELSKYDDKIWCALEYNYDLASLVDIRDFDGGVLESLRLYLDKKKPGGRYTDKYIDSHGNEYFDSTGSIPYYRTVQADKLVDDVFLRPSFLEDLSRLDREYEYFEDRGVRIYVSYACIDIEDVPEEEQGNLELMGDLYREKFEAMDGPVVISDINDYVFYHREFYDTVYHLLTQPAEECTKLWIKDLLAQLTSDGLWGDDA